MLYIVGLGLSSIEDISLAGLNAIKNCEHVFLDAYTSILTHDVTEVSRVCGKDVKLADREFVEQDPSIISLADTQNVAFLVVGDPLGATTHTDLILRAIKANISYKVFHNASIITAVGCCGLQLYRFGETISIPFWDEFGEPDSFYNKIIYNYVRGLHTLCLLDIKVKEKSLDNLLRDRKIYEPPRYMNCSQAASQIREAGLRIRKNLELRLNVPEDGDEPPSRDYPADKCFLSEDCLVVCFARVGANDQSMVVSTLGCLSNLVDSPEHPLLVALGGPLHTLVIPSNLHPMEEEMLTARLLVDSQDNAEGTALPHIFTDSFPVSNENYKENVKTMFHTHNKLATDSFFVIRDE